MNLTHQNVGWDLVELDVLEEVAKDLFKRQLVRVKVDLRRELNLIFAFYSTVVELLFPLYSSHTGLLSQDFLLHMRAAWNFVNSSARNSSRHRMRRTTCCGRSVKLPRFNTSLPCSSTNSRTFWTRDFVHLYWMYRSAEASSAQTVSTLMQHCTKPAHARRSSSSP